MNKISNTDLIEAQREILARIREHHIRPWRGSRGDIFFISDTYPGVWLEHTFDAIAWADYMPEDHRISANQIRLFLDNQKKNGQLPCYIWRDEIGYAQLQECVSFGRLCIEAYRQNPEDKELLKDAYTGVKKWIEWQEEYRMPNHLGLVEMFCGYDTGHDNSGRLKGLKYPRNNPTQKAETLPEDDGYLPIIAPDINACYYGNLMALSEMAKKLKSVREAAVWESKAEDVRKRLSEVCFDPDDLFFYDVDRYGRKRKVKSISVTNVLSEGAVADDLAKKIIETHLLNKDEFWTEYPFPAVSINDPTWIQNLPGNSWGFYSQGLTCLRTLLWMEKYGYSEQFRTVMDKWLTAWINSSSTRFGQELHPITGQPSECSQYYSSCMIYLLYAMRRLYGV